MKNQITTSQNDNLFPIKGTTYRVSVNGEIINKHGRPLIGSGPQIKLMVEKKLTVHRISRLVWSTINNKKLSKRFIVVHMDGDHTNNAINNLKIMTRSKLMKLPTINRKLRKKPRNVNPIKYAAI